MDPILPVTVLSLLLGSLIAFIFLQSYFRKRRSEVQSLSNPELHADPKKPSKPPQSISKRSHSKPHSHASDKVLDLRHFLGAERNSNCEGRRISCIFILTEIMKENLELYNEDIVLSYIPEWGFFFFI